MAELPYLGTDANGVVSLFVDGAPYIALGGEIHNSSSSNLDYMEEEVWPCVEQLHLDTLIVPLAWESVEPREGVYDFTLLDGLLSQARLHGCKLVLLWFGLWKNGESMYVPGWVKTDTKRFFRAMCVPGAPTQTVSPFCAAGIEADAKAFSAVMARLGETDTERTVILVQVENEVGLLSGERDRCEKAEAAYSQDIPEAMKDFAEASGSWAAAYGEDAPEYFMAYHYARALDAIAAAGKKEYNLPMYANAWLSQFPDRPGHHPSGGPVARVLPVWKACAPHLDFLAPDIYVSDFTAVCDAYTKDGGPLLVPEARRDPVTASNVFYALGHYNALGFAPFGIDAFLKEQEEPNAQLLEELNIDAQSFNCLGTAPFLEASYRLLREMKPLLLKYRGTKKLRSFIRRSNHDRGIILPMNGYDLQLTYKNVRFRKPESAGIVIEPEPGVILIAGCNVKAEILPKKGSDTYITPVSLQEGTFWQGEWIPCRVLNGDERGLSLLGDYAGAIRMEFSVSSL